MLLAVSIVLGWWALQVSDSRGRRVDDGQVKHVGDDSRTVQVALKPGLVQASYTVSWRVVSVDGHPLSGTFAFGVDVPAGTVQQQASVDPLVAVVHTLAQLLAYVGTALLLGCSCLVVWLWPDGAAAARIRRLTVAAVATAAIGSVATVLVQGPCVAAGRHRRRAHPGRPAERTAARLSSTGTVLWFTPANVALVPANRSIGPIRVGFASDGEGQARASGVVVPSTGRWTLTVQVLTNDTTDCAATTTNLVR